MVGVCWVLVQGREMTVGATGVLTLRWLLGEELGVIEVTSCSCGRWGGGTTSWAWATGRLARSIVSLGTGRLLGKELRLV